MPRGSLLNESTTLLNHSGTRWEKVEKSISRLFPRKPTSKRRYWWISNAPRHLGVSSCNILFLFSKWYVEIENLRYFYSSKEILLFVQCLWNCVFLNILQIEILWTKKGYIFLQAKSWEKILQFIFKHLVLYWIVI